MSNRKQIYKASNSKSASSNWRGLFLNCKYPSKGLLGVHFTAGRDLNPMFRVARTQLMEQFFHQFPTTLQKISRDMVRMRTTTTQTNSPQPCTLYKTAVELMREIRSSPQLSSRNEVLVQRRYVSSQLGNPRGPAKSCVPLVKPQVKVSFKRYTKLRKWSFWY